MSAGPGLPGLAAIDVWRIDLDATEIDRGHLHSVLSAQEAARAARFVDPLDRRRWANSRGALRSILAGYLGVGGGAIAFEHGPHGKPYLIRSLASHAELYFNMTHSADIALVGVSRAVPLGIDVECWRELTDFDGVVERVFTEAERRALTAMPDAVRLAAFYAGWTRKEALIKATGAGFSMPLDSFSVSLDPDRPSRVLVPPPGDNRPWFLCHLQPRPRCSGALAVQGIADCEVVVHDFEMPGGPAGPG